jgi:hypothetical protein
MAHGDLASNGVNEGQKTAYRGFRLLNAPRAKCDRIPKEQRDPDEKTIQKDLRLVFKRNLKEIWNGPFLSWFYH